jgi:hypothetical protein
VNARTRIPVIRSVPVTERLPIGWLPETLPIDVSCIERPAPSPGMREEGHMTTERMNVRGLS